MNRFAVIENGMVSNIVEATAEIALNNNWVEARDACIGDSYVGGIFSRPNQDEKKAANIRAQRDRLLSSSDWTQVADAPVDQTAWAAYRQGLRDIPSQEGFPNEVTWPTEPE